MNKICTEPLKGQYFFFRSLEILFRSLKILFRSLEILFRSLKILFRSIKIIPFPRNHLAGI